MKHCRHFFNGADGILHDPVHEILYLWKIIHPLGALAAGDQSIFLVSGPYSIDTLDLGPIELVKLNPV